MPELELPAEGEELTDLPAEQELQASDGDAPDPDPAFERLLDFMKESRSFDFTGYKRPSLMRRVWHRMRELEISSFDEYQDVLALQPEEFTALFNTILINVTGFFRDADAWQLLAEDVLPAMLASTDGGPLRIWSAGSSSGQEAYSMAMLLHDAMGADRFKRQVKIYATDVDEGALGRARQATYSEREVSGLPARFGERYLERTGGRFRVSSDLRRSVIFGRNDLTRDAPISRIDVLLCRNTLMYFNAETQSRIVDRLAFALRPAGVLFLGKAEMLLNHSSTFDPLDLKRRFFRRALVDQERVVPATSERARRHQSQGDQSTLRDEVLATNPVAQIAVDALGRLAIVNHRATTMLGIDDRDIGRPFQDLEVSYRPTELRSQLRKVSDGRAPVLLREVEWRRPGVDPVFVDIEVVPLFDADGSQEGASISFTDVTGVRRLRVEVEETNRQLELAYEELQSTNEELETTNEELQSTVEELETTNEELQSTNEELETMNEELQSSNDELQSTNDQLRERTSEVTELNAFMQSILGSLDAAVIVVDRHLVVQIWTEQARELWGLRSEETVGRHLLNLDSGLPIAELHPWLRSVALGHEELISGRLVDAVNRRGKAVQLRITVSALQTVAGSPSGALVLMEDLSTLTPQVPETGSSDS